MHILLIQVKFQFCLHKTQLLKLFLETLKAFLLVRKLHILKIDITSYL